MTMGVKILIFHKTQFIFLIRKMFSFFRVLWLSFFTLFGFTTQYLFSFQEKFIYKKKIFNSRLIEQKEDKQTTNGNTVDVNDGDRNEDDESEPILRFRFPTYEEFLQNNRNIQSTGHPVLCDNRDEEVSYVDIDTKVHDYEGSKVSNIDESSNELTHVEEIVEPKISSEIQGLPKVINDGNSIDEFLVRKGVDYGDLFHKEKVSKAGLDVSVSQKDGVGASFVYVRENSEELEVENEEEVSEQVNDSIAREDETENCSELPSDDVSVSIDDARENSEKLKVDSEEEMSEQVKDSVSCKDDTENGSEFPNDDESLMSHSVNNEDVMRNEKTNSRSDDEPLESEFDLDSLELSSQSSFRSSFIDSLSDGFLSDIDFERAFEIDNSSEFGLNEVNLTKEALTEEDIELQNLWKGYEADDCDEEDEDILRELKNLEANLEENDASLSEEHGGKMESETQNNQKDVKDEKSSSGEQLSSDSDEQNGLETQWEHQDLLEQLRMEIRKVRAIGLPTILEESESPKIMDDLKPWKIEEKFHRGGTIDDLHKFYKTYKERMRKLDILNYQKMYAIGFLRLKDPLQSFTKNKISTSSLSAIVSLDCWPCKPKSIPEVHQPVMKKFTNELESDLEMVYVGQMCLSWEFLRWQYGKALDLWETDQQGIHRYNEAADKFQTFQVLLTRFLEDEPFEGPRVQNYVKKRCVHRNLLQIPLIGDDNKRDRRKEIKEMSSKDAITSLQLVEIIEESIRIFWQFIKTDKDPNNVALFKCRRDYCTKVELQNPADANLLKEIRSTLQKKEKKIKEISRIEKCILRKIQRHQEDEDSYSALHFFSQVDLRLIARVLNMPRITTDQLVWCSDKLSNIQLVGRKLHFDESLVLLFPCS